MFLTLCNTTVDANIDNYNSIDMYQIYCKMFYIKLFALSFPFSSDITLDCLSHTLLSVIIGSSTLCYDLQDSCIIEKQLKLIICDLIWENHMLHFKILNEKLHKQSCYAAICTGCLPNMVFMKIYH